MTLFSIIYSYAYPIFITGGRGAGIDGVLFALVYLAVAAAIITFVSATGSLFTNAEKRMEAYCVLKSLGCADKDLYRLSLLESIYLAWDILWRGFTGVFISSLFMGIWANSVMDNIPVLTPMIIPFIIFTVVDLTVCGIIAIYTVFRLRGMNISESIKNCNL